MSGPVFQTAWFLLAVVLSVVVFLVFSIPSFSRRRFLPLQES
jgi:hypothetical protein